MKYGRLPLLTVSNHGKYTLLMMLNDSYWSLSLSLSLHRHQAKGHWSLWAMTVAGSHCTIAVVSTKQQTNSAQIRPTPRTTNSQSSVLRNATSTVCQKKTRSPTGSTSARRIDEVNNKKNKQGQHHQPMSKTAKKNIWCTFLDQNQRAQKGRQNIEWHGALWQLSVSLFSLMC